eukprot:gnl/Dysnectes_brevis/1993_a2294_1898.p1 GENE.gnl/Dysnectes_brevis/1993_a2294_1898~~gnl/Dysnectes_brevis/1993_a2294_1898.p1  ORF type:complete len:260 (+),score=49.90 gnl/Dysnectes_brevis/1993_a2294_1898:48-827(+)
MESSVSPSIVTSYLLGNYRTCISAFKKESLNEDTPSTASFMFYILASLQTVEDTGFISKQISSNFSDDPSFEYLTALLSSSTSVPFPPPTLSTARTSLAITAIAKGDSSLALKALNRQTGAFNSYLRVLALLSHRREDLAEEQAELLRKEHGDTLCAQLAQGQLGSLDALQDIEEAHGESPFLSGLKASALLRAGSLEEAEEVARRGLRLASVEDDEGEDVVGLYACLLTSRAARGLDLEEEIAELEKIRPGHPLLLKE